MARVGLLLCLSAFLVREANADCVAQPPRQTTVEIDTCTSDAKGMALAGSTPTDGYKSLTVVIPASEKLSCTKLVAGVLVNGTLETTCTAGAETTLTKITVVSPRHVKQLTRAQLEAEVQQLRIDNAKMRAQLRAAKAREIERMEQLKREQQKLNTKLRD